MGKKTRTGTGGRRTILQLFPPRSGAVCGREDSLGSASEDEQEGNGDEYSFPREVTTEMRMPVKATEGLSLLGAYEDSDDEEDADPQPPSVRTQHQSADILANFMAEIDAITTQPGSEEPTGDPSALAPTPPRPEPKAQQHASEMGTEPESTGADFQYDTHTSLAGVGGLEMGDWQEVWDDNTGCYYYWNTQTNEVAWQLPYYLAHQVQGLQQYTDSSTVNGNGATQSAGCYAEQHSTAVSSLTSKTKKEVMESVVALTSEEEERHGVAASLLGPLIPAEVKEAEEKWRKRLVGGLEERENSLEDSLPGSPAPPLNEPDTPTHPLRDQCSRNQSEEDSDAEETEEDTMELELALDRKKAELRALEEGDCSVGGSSPCSEASQEAAAGLRSLLPKKAMWKTAFLRAASPDSNSRDSDTREDPDTAHSKVPEKAGEEEDQETGDKMVPNVPPKEEVETPELKFQIGELANTLTSKMEFLGINKKTISNFQLLLLQTETRIADWREGALNGIYLRRRLQEAAEHIKHYELNAAPKGWSCHWDREQRRYFYTNDRTSASQWDFPAEEDVEEVENTKTSIHGDPKPPPVPTGGLAVAGASVFTPIVPPQPGLPSYWSVPQPPLPPDQPPPPADSPPPPPPPPESPPPLPPPPLEDDGEIEEVEMEDDDSEPPAPGTEPPLPPGVVGVVGVKVVESTASLGKSQKRKASGSGQLTKAVTIGSSAILYTQTIATAGAAYWGESAVATPPLPSETVAPPLPPPPTRPPLPPAQAPSALDPTGFKTLLTDKTKKLKKDKSKKSKTKMPSLVKKWQSIQKELDEEEQASSSDEDRDQLNKRSIEEWKQQQLLTGKAGKNANFEALPDDWRERMLKKRKMMKST
ncbi:formin-binding protein 4 [Oncorhynchus kisutch]|uniref:Formin binding protein 4 n=1 Tax=Oncorhynchus kisutch TaxID=8019 RepID=A0A8C7N0V3_ONCKI|nr:formin-binding protein 4 [Oncorhynchus kisutch]